MVEQVATAIVASERLTSGAMSAVIAPIIVMSSAGLRPEIGVTLTGESITPREWVSNELSLPKLDDSAARGKPWYTKTVEQVVNIMWAIIVSRAMADHFPIDEARVIETRLPESRQSRVAVAIFAKQATAAQTIAFWNSLEPNFQRWMRFASPTTVRDFLTKVSPHFYWGDTYH
jgi:hypothetical protein